MNQYTNLKCSTIDYSIPYRLGKIGGGSDVGEDDSWGLACFGSFPLPSEPSCMANNLSVPC